MRQSAVNERDLSRKRWEDPGTVWRLALVGSLELARGAKLELRYYHIGESDAEYYELP